MATMLESTSIELKSDASNAFDSEGMEMSRKLLCKCLSALQGGIYACGSAALNCMALQISLPYLCLQRVEASRD